MRPAGSLRRLAQEKLRETQEALAAPPSSPSNRAALEHLAVRIAAELTGQSLLRGRMVAVLLG